MKTRTAAEQQIEMLRQMKESKAKRKAAPLPAPAPSARVAQPDGQAKPVPFELG